MAVARLGVSVDEFYRMSPAEYYQSMHEFGKMKQRDVEIQHEVMRLQTMYLVNIQVAKEKRIYDLEKFMPFSWDKDHKPRQTVDEMKQIMMTVAKRQNKKFEKK